MASAAASSSASTSAAASPASLPPQILLLGLRRSGKSSLLQVLVNHLPPNDTLYLDSTLKATPYPISIWPSTPLIIWDGISSASLLSHRGKSGLVIPNLPNLTWSAVKSVIWVIDAQDDYLTSLSSLHALLLVAYAHNPSIHFHVFLHKMDGLSEDYRDDTQTDVQKRIDDELSDSSSTFTFAEGFDAANQARKEASEEREEVEAEQIDWDKLEAHVRSKELERGGAADATHSSSLLAPASTQDDRPSTSPTQLKARPSSSRSRTKSSSQTRRALRRNPSSSSSHLLSSRGAAAALPPNIETDLLLTLYQTSIYDSSLFIAFSRVFQCHNLFLPHSSSLLKASLVRLVDSLVEACELEKMYLIHLPTRTFVTSDASPFDKNAYEVVCDYLGFLTGITGLFVNLRPPQSDSTAAVSETQQTQLGTPSAAPNGDPSPNPATTTSSSSSSSSSSSTLHLSPSSTLLFHQMTPSLASISILRTAIYDRKRQNVEGNIDVVFRRALQKIIETSVDKA